MFALSSRPLPMPIVVSCSCGQRFAARDDLAGKTVACPKCKASLTIPAAPAAPAAASPATPTAPSAAGQVIPVACSCGRRFGARPDLAGKTMKCPACGAALAIPAPRAAPGGAASQPAAAPAVAGGIADLLDDHGVHKSKTGARCQNCRVDMQPGTIICIQCGYNHETGQKIQTRRWT